MNVAELKKNSWIYSSKVSLIGIAVVYILSLILVKAFGESRNFSETVFAMNLGFFTIFTTIWGMFAVSGAIISELRNRTWVYQKMSAIKAFDMCVGKLFGPTIYQWILGAVFLAISLILILTFDDGKAQAFNSLVNLVIITLLLHASALVLSLLAIKRNEYSTDIGNVKSAPMILFMAIVIYSATKAMELTPDSSFTWYGMNFSPKIFNLLSLTAFMVWTMIAYYRNMQEELQYQNKPYYWVAFNFFLLLFYGGLVLNPDWGKGGDLFSAYFAVSFSVLLVATLLSLLLVPINVVAYNSFMKKISTKDWSKIFDITPLWMISSAFSFVVCLLLCASLYFKFGTGSSDEIDNFFLIPLVAFLFLIKSLLVNLYLHLAQVKRANFIWFLYMATWYGLLPAVFGFNSALFLFYPTHVLISGVAVVLYITIMIFLIRRTISKANILEEVG